MKASFPSKTWSILACGSPLVASVDLGSNFAKELVQNDLPYVCDAENHKELVGALLLGLEDNRNRASRRVEYIKRNYSKENILGQYKQIMMEIDIEHNYQ